MPSPLEFKSRIIKDVSESNKFDAEAAYHDYLACHCYHPQRVLLYDSHLGYRDFREVPCGDCYHCRETKINSWVTRMYAHCEDFKHVYFVTLTYRGYNTINPVSRYIMRRFADCCWHYDNKNETHRYAYHPCLLVKKHYQDFLKRLRKNTGYDDITYCVSGEYGHRWSRPHMHFILFTNNVLTRQQICDAWSVNLFYDSESQTVCQYNGQKSGKKLHYLLGRVDFNDLVENGTFNSAQKVKIDGTYYSGDKCFAYVCKYVCKNDDCNISRVLLAYNSMYHKEKYVRLFDQDMPINDVSSTLKKMKMHVSSTHINLFKKKFSYEKVILEFKPELFTEGLSTSRTFSQYGHKIVADYFPKDLFEFKKCFKPFVEFSRGTPLGSVYAKTHLHEFVTGVYNKPKLQVKGFVVPTYFTRKVSEYIFGLRQLSPTLSGVSPHSFNLPLMRDYFVKVLEGKESFGYIYKPDPFAAVDRCLFNPTKCLVEKTFNGTLRYVFPITDDGIFANAYKYDKSLRCYMLESSVPLTDFLKRQLYNVNEIIRRHNADLFKAVIRHRDKEAACNLLKSEFGLDLQESHYSFLRKQMKYLHDKQVDYNMLHNFVE